MTVNKIQTPREYLDHVVNPDVADFATNPTDLRSAYHACNSLLSLRDWVFETHRSTQWSHGGVARQPFNSKRELQQSLEALDQRFKIVTDVANASKHMVLEPGRGRTNLYGNANTEVQTIGGGIGGPIGAPIGGAISSIMVKIDSTQHSVVDCIQAVHNVWRNLFAENAW